MLRTHADAVALRRRLVPGARVGVIGGGFIGLELASSAAALGCAVTVIELGPRLMGRAVPPRIAAVMAKRHVAAGIDVRCGAAVTGLAGVASGTAITLAEGGTVEADVIVAGVGAVPETSLAEAAGIATSDGVAVDSRFATSAPGVFAAGDCCRYPHPLYDGTPLRLESWRAAREHGAAAARAMLGAAEPYAGVPWFWSDQHDLTLHVAGLASAAAREAVRARPDGTEIWFGLAAEGRLVAAAAVGPGNAVAKDIKLAELLIARRAARTPPSWPTPPSRSSHCCAPGNPPPPVPGPDRRPHPADPPSLTIPSPVTSTPPLSPPPPPRHLPAPLPSAPPPSAPDTLCG